jgi:hypothetical protein
MKNALKTTSRFAVLGLLVAGLSGCGTQNPMAPTTTDTAATPAMSTQAASAPMFEDPGSSDPGVWVAETPDVPAPRKAKKPKRSDHPGRGVGVGGGGWEIGE